MNVETVWLKQYEFLDEASICKLTDFNNDLLNLYLRT